MEQRKNSEAKIAANNRYSKKAYDPISLRIKTGTKSQLQAQAIALGESLNMFIKKAIEERYNAVTGEDIEL